MQRRDFIKRAGLGLAAASTATVANLAAAEDLPPIKWRLASSFPKSLDTLYGTSELLTLQQELVDYLLRMKNSLQGAETANPKEGLNYNSFT